MVRLDVPFYDPRISEQAVAQATRFAQEIGMLSGPVGYHDIVATQFADLWRT